MPTANLRAESRLSPRVLNPHVLTPSKSYVRMKPHFIHRAGSGIRALGLVCVASCITAVLVGHYTPSPIAEVSSLRKATPPARVFVRPSALSITDSSPYLLDPETGHLEKFPNPEGEFRSQGSDSPWRDARAQSQIVESRMDRSTGEYCLTRSTFPGGQLLDRIPSKLALAGAPCWFPGTLARVLFAGRDGALYQLAFEEFGTPGMGRGLSIRPKPLSWREQPAGARRAIFSDPTWPTDSRLRGRVIVSVQLAPLGSQSSSFGPARLWWLSLSQDGSEIVAGAPLIQSNPDETSARAQMHHERLHAVSSGPHGSLVLAYLVHRPSYEGYELRVGKIRLDPRTGHPSVIRGDEPPLADGCVSVAPTFSSDGRWITCFVKPRGVDAPASVWRGDVQLALNCEPSPYDDVARAMDLAQTDVTRPDSGDRSGPLHDELASARSSHRKHNILMPE
jgi:hypothetical protein